MGYDMHMVEHEGMDRDTEYFRANIWGMGILRGAMEAAGILDVEHESPEWPRTEEQRENESDDDYEDRCNNECAPVRSFRSKDSDLVPIGKFCSNDGWHVVPEECLLIADALDELLFSNQQISYENWMGETSHIDPDDLEYVKRFSDYCRRAADKKGFTVW